MWGWLASRERRHWERLVSRCEQWAIRRANGVPEQPFEPDPFMIDIAGCPLGSFPDLEDRYTRAANLVRTIDYLAERADERQPEAAPWTL